MPVKNFTVVNSPGIIRDIPNQVLSEGIFTDGKNYRFNQTGAEPHVGDRAVFSEASITPLWIQPFPPITAPKWVYADLADIWAVDNTTHTKITRVSGVYTSSAQERWQSTVLNGVGIFNNGVDLPQSWAAFEPSTLLIDLPNWTSTRRAKSIKAFKNYLIALNMTDSGVPRPYRITWSSPAQPGSLPASWDVADPATEANEFDLAETQDHLVDSLVLSDINIIYKENSTWGMSFIGPPFYFRFWRILSHRGLLHRDCAVNIPLGHCVATQDDIIVHGGQVGQATSILDKKTRKSLFNSIDTVNFRSCFMFADNAKNEVWFCYPEVGSTYASKALIWDWTTNSVGERELTPTPFAAVGPVGDSLITDRIWG